MKAKLCTLNNHIGAVGVLMLGKELSLGAVTQSVSLFLFGVIIHWAIQHLQSLIHPPGLDSPSLASPFTGSAAKVMVVRTMGNSRITEWKMTVIVPSKVGPVDSCNVNLASWNSLFT